MSSYGGKGCIFDNMCKEAGVINGVSAAGIKNGQQITKEMLVKIDPDLLIMPVYNDHGNFDIKKYNQEFLEDPSLQTMRAIKNKQLFYPNEGYIRQSLRYAGRAAFKGEVESIIEKTAPLSIGNDTGWCSF